MSQDRRVDWKSAQALRAALNIQRIVGTAGALGSLNLSGLEQDDAVALLALRYDRRCNADRRKQPR